MKMNNLNDMTDLSFTQTSRAMSSKPLNRSANKTQSIMELANKQDKSKPKVTKRYSGNDSVFMGC